MQLPPRLRAGTETPACGGFAHHLEHVFQFIGDVVVITQAGRQRRLGEGRVGEGRREQRRLPRREPADELEQLGEEAQVEEAEARLRQIDVDLARSVLVAPFAATVSERLIDEGVVVSGGLREGGAGLCQCRRRTRSTVGEK